MVTVQMAGEVAESQTSSTQGWLSVVSMTDGTWGVTNNPVEYEGEKPVLDPRAMIEGQPYPVNLYGVRAWAVKDADGAINVYCLPE